MKGSFRYLKQESTRSWLEAPEGQRSLSFAQGWVMAAMERAGAFRLGVMIPAFERTPVLDLSAEQVTACVERLVELGELVELTASDAANEARVFVRERTLWDASYEALRASRGARGPVYLRLVMVLTELRKHTEPVTMLSLCSRIEGEEGEVRALVDELVRRGKAELSGDWVKATGNADEWKGGRGDAQLVLDSRRRLDQQAVMDSLERMQGKVNEGDHEAAHGEQVELYERLLEELATEGNELAPLVLKARVIVRRWE